MLELQNKIQHYHLDTEDIPDYINALENAQNKSNQAGNIITASTLLLIANNTIISTEHFPCADKSLEGLSKDKKDWATWENLYKAADQKAKVKNQAVGGQDQFGATHVTLKKSPPHVYQSNGLLGSADEVGEYFNALAESVTT